MAKKSVYSPKWVAAQISDKETLKWTVDTMCQKQSYMFTCTWLSLKLTTTWLQVKSRYTFFTTGTLSHKDGKMWMKRLKHFFASHVFHTFAILTGLCQLLMTWNMAGVSKGFWCKCIITLLHILGHLPSPLNLKNLQNFKNTYYFGSWLCFRHQVKTIQQNEIGLLEADWFTPSNGHNWLCCTEVKPTSKSLHFKTV